MKAMVKAVSMLVLFLGGVSVSFAWYNPQTGRWLSRDPIGASGGSSPYSTANNDMLNNCDYRGLLVISFDPRFGPQLREYITREVRRAGIVANDRWGEAYRIARTFEVAANSGYRCGKCYYLYLDLKIAFVRVGDTLSSIAFDVDPHDTGLDPETISIEPASPSGEGDIQAYVIRGERFRIHLIDFHARAPAYLHELAHVEHWDWGYETYDRGTWAVSSISEYALSGYWYNNMVSFNSGPEMFYITIADALRRIYGDETVTTCKVRELIRLGGRR